ncbi:MAG: S8 family peptidase [Eubacterium sp.]
MNRVREIVKASYAHNSHIYGDGSCIAILDSGIALHPDFDHRIIGWYDVLSSKHSPYDDYGHGTHVAGIAAGNGAVSRGLYRGIAPKARLVIVKVLNRYGEGTVKDICAGIDWVLKNRIRYHINIVNISVGTEKEKQFDESSPLVRKVEELWDAGIVVVVSAGNRGPEHGTISAPGNSRKVITVGYYGREGNSGTGPTIHCIKKPDVITPGSHIVSCHHTNIEKVPYTKKSGTSMATPVVSGGIALLLSLPKYQFYEPKEVKIRLKNSCTDLGLPHNKQGWGLFDLKKFLF